jgi:hypothetical protein
MSDQCNETKCTNCKCKKRYSGSRSVNDFPANSTLAPSIRPLKVARRDPFKAIVELQKRYSESMNILS